jgi:hypothetical protein
MIKYQRLLQKEYSKSQQTITRQALQVSKLERDLQRQEKIVNNHQEEYKKMQLKLTQRSASCQIIL